LTGAPSPIQLQNVSFDYDTAPLLRDVNYTFAAHAVTAVLGRSGSGKSTMLELINGMLRPKAGTVAVFGKPLDYAQVYALRSQIGYVVQSAALFPHMTVGRNMSLSGVVQGQSQDVLSARVRTLLAMAQLPEAYADKYPHELSGGEQQRVSLCRAMFLNPPILLMDEPFSALDYGTKLAIYAHFQAWQAAEPRTVILVTHDWEEAKQLADAFVWIDDGCIRSHGQKEELDRWKEEYLAHL
jgi:osmoprotectant transport system ATP-binding protein